MKLSPFDLRRGLALAGLSQRQLALRLALPETYLSRIACGRCVPSWQTACRIADAACVSLDMFRRLPPPADEQPAAKPRRRKRQPAKGGAR